MTGDRASKEINELIARYLRNECSPEDLQRLTDYFKEHGLSEQNLEDDPLFHPHAEQSHKMYSRVIKELSFQHSNKGKLRLLQTNTRLSRIVAVLIPLILVSALFLLLHRHEAPSLHQFRNEGEKPSYIQLPDGTAVWLNKGASLQWDSTGFSGDRNVSLLGEAYFDVATDKTHPFTVSAGSLKTTVLGTSFDCRADFVAHTATITLVTGKVSLNTTHTKEKILLPGQAAVYNELTQTLQSAAIPFYALTWKTAELTCDDEPMDGIIHYISSYYHTPIRLSSDIHNLKFTGAISLKDDLSAVLDRLLFVHQLQFKKAGNEILIY